MKLFPLKQCKIVLALVCMMTAAAYAETTVPSAPPERSQLAQVPVQAPAVLPVVLPSMENRISLDLRNIDVIDALKYLSMKAGINIITTKAVTGRVTLMVENTPIKDVFDIMLRSNDLAYDVQGEIYNVMSQEEYRNLYGKSFSDVRQVKIFYLKYTIPEQAFSLLDMVKSDIGRVMVDPETGNVLVMDSPDRIRIMAQALKDFEEKNTVKVIKLNYAKAKDIEEALKAQLDTKKVGLIKADEKGNQVIIQTLSDRMEQIESLVKDLDQKTREIIVDVNIVKLNLSDGYERSVQWEGLFDAGRQMGMNYIGSYPFSSVLAATDTWTSRKDTWEAVGNIGSYPFTGTTTNYSAGKQSIGMEEMHLGVVGKHDFDVIFKYLQTVGKTKILSNPKIAVVNNQEAKIHVGQKEAYVTTTTTTGQTTNTVSEQVTFVDVGVIISVVPAINSEGYITLKIKAEINSVVDTLVTPTNNQIPIIDTSLAETTVMVKDGSTVIIGGLRKDTIIEAKEQTPFFASIPILGKLFSAHSKGTRREELLIIMTPRTITGDTLVSGKELGAVGKPMIKSTKEYTRIKEEEFEMPAQNPAFIPAQEKKLGLKGLRDGN